MPGGRLRTLLLLFAPPTAVCGGDVPAGVGPRGEGPAARVPSFQGEIRPLFEAKCLRCHGGQARKADLDLSTPAGVMKGGESGPAVVPGHLSRATKQPAWTCTRKPPSSGKLAMKRWMTYCGLSVPVMREQYNGWQKASHHAVATCNDCHVLHEVVPKYLVKAENTWATPSGCAKPRRRCEPSRCGRPCGT